VSDGLLVLNAGSSSLKHCVFVGSAGGEWRRGEHGQVDAAGPRTLDAVPMPAGITLRAVAHRVVHGGDRRGAAIVTPDLLDELRALSPLAPLHQPQNLAAIDAIAARMPGVAQVACFDTAFHADWSDVATLVPLPAEIRALGVRRYGYHGLSYEHVADALKGIAPEVADGRVIAGHLGSGASLCALRAGRSVDSTFGLTALDGLCMGTRPGALDPGVVLHLIRERGMSAAEVESLLYRRSGLLGISGLDSDMRVLLASGEPAARLAVEYFVYRAVREIGALAAMLGGLDALVFTGGIGENSAEIRARICAGIASLGVDLDAEANRAGSPRITRPGSRVPALVIASDEEVVIARQALATLGLGTLAPP
jgi:acetate kinase